MKRLLVVAVLLTAVSQAQAGIGSRCAKGFNYVRKGSSGYQCVMPLTQPTCLAGYDLKATVLQPGQLRAYSCVK